MKKMIVALALVALASPAFAALAGSKHDFSGQASYAITGQAKCRYCHMPHNAQTWANVALWARPATDAVLTWYTGGSAIETQADRQGTATCLSCHGDASVASSGLANKITGVANVGADGMTNDHPVARDSNAVQASTWNLRKSNVVLGRTTWTYSATSVMRIQCASCHSVHNSTGTGAKLLYTNGAADIAGTMTAQDLCSTCHGV